MPIMQAEKTKNIINWLLMNNNQKLKKEKVLDFQT